MACRYMEIEQVRCDQELLSVRLQLSEVSSELRQAYQQMVWYHDHRVDHQSSGALTEAAKEELGAPENEHGYRNVLSVLMPNELRT